MLLYGTQKVNSHGHLEIGGCDAVELARTFGTPLYVMDEVLIRERCREYVEAFRAVQPEAKVYFAGKALLCGAMCRIVEQEGLGLDVATEGELLTATRAQFPPDRLVVHGNYKSHTEIELALAYGAGRIVVDSLGELDQIASHLPGNARPTDVLLRLTPGIVTNTHSYIQTGQEDTKFGIPRTQAAAAVRRALELPGFRLRGYHCHIGSQLFGLDCFDRAVALMADIAAEVRSATGYSPEELNLGGGLGIHYRWSDQPPAVADLAAVVGSAAGREFPAHDLPVPALAVEPGRSIVGEAGTTLYTAGVVKEVPHTRLYVSVDGGMSDNPRPALYNARYQMIVANKGNQPVNQTVTLAGKHCECDTLIVDAEVPPIEPGDIVAVQSTGAYNYSMASNYNRMTKPAVVLVRDGQADLIVRRQTVDEVLAQDVIPERLRE